MSKLNGVKSATAILMTLSMSGARSLPSWHQLLPQPRLLLKQAIFQMSSKVTGQRTSLAPLPNATSSTGFLMALLSLMPQ